MELYKKDELQKSLDKIHDMENPVTYYNESMSKDDLKGLVQKYDFMPHGYGYEFNDENVEVVNKTKIVGIDYSKEKKQIF